MDREEIEDDLPLIEFYYDEVIERFERQTTRVVRKVSRKAVIDEFMKTRDFKGTATRLSVSVSTVYQILSQACYFARRCARVTPERGDLQDR